MGYTITKAADGDVNLGNLNGEVATLVDSVSDYATGGYAIVGGETANNNGTPNLINCDLWRILTVLPTSGWNGYSCVWNPSTQKLQVYSSPNTEVSNGADLSGLTFGLLIVGY